MIYKPMGEGIPDMVYLGSLTNFDLTYAWAQDKCVPLVREITFENGEVCYLLLLSFYLLDVRVYIYIKKTGGLLWSLCGTAEALKGSDSICF